MQLHSKSEATLRFLITKMMRLNWHEAEVTLVSKLSCCDLLDLKKIPLNSIN